MNQLPPNSRIIFKGIVGSQSYGLATETSDVDIKGIYIQSNEDLLSNNYIPQVDVNKDDRLGETYITNEGYEVKIIEYFCYTNCTVQFADGTIIYRREYGDIKKGTISNPNHKSVHGVGYLGVGKYKRTENGVCTKCHCVWTSMLARCYNNNFHQSNPTYKNSSVIPEWHNFQNFAEWYYDNYNPEIMIRWQFDKDIITKGNKIYSPKTCCFVPQEINTILLKAGRNNTGLPIGVQPYKSKYKTSVNINGIKTHIGYFNTPEQAFQAYKTAKENYIKEVADKWKDKIAPNVYEALINYQVEITD